MACGTSRRAATGTQGPRVALDVDVGLLQTVRAHPPPGPFRRRSWRSPLRGPWLTSVLGLTLLAGMSVLALTGFASWVAYGANARPAYSQVVPGVDLTPLLPTWPTEPVWLYRVTEGTHVVLGFVLVPVVLAKLWSFTPKLFQWPPVNGPAQLLERLSLAGLVGGAVLLMVTGLFNVQGWFPWEFSFYTVHFWSAVVFVAAMASHVVVKAPTWRRALRDRPLRQELRRGLAETEQESDDHGLVALDPEPPTVSRRGALAGVGGVGLLLGGLTVGQTFTAGWVRETALLGPRGRDLGDGPNDFQVNKTAASARVGPDDVGPAYRLVLQGPDGAETTLSREDLLALPQTTEDLPIACVEGWSTQQTWSGVRLKDLRALAGVEERSDLFVRSLQPGGAFAQATIAAAQAEDDRAVLALRVNGADLSLDHGFPARLMVPGLPGVLQTKWVARIVWTGETG